MVFFAGVIAVVIPRIATSTQTRTQESAPSAVAVRQITLATKDLVYDPLTQRIYASVPSSAGGIGNSITQIDPVLGTVGASVSIGSEPGKLAISDNSQYIYVALGGAAAVRRFDLTTQTAGLQFSLGSGISGVYSAEDISVMPGQADTVAISREDPNFNHGGVAIYDNGVVRANTTPPPTGSNVIEFSPNASTLYGYNNESSEFGLRKMAVDSFGVTVVSTTRNLISNFGTNIVQHNGLLYSTRGQVVDPETLTRVGTFPLTDFPSFVLPDSSANRVYFLSGFFSSTVTLRAFDLTTFVQVGSLSINGISGNPSSLIKWGTDGLAFRTSGNQVFLVSTSEIASFPATPIPAPTQEAAGIKSLSLVANDLVFDPNSQKVYASLPSGAGTFGNSIAAITPTTGVMETPIFIGSEPHRLAISDNAQYVYAGLDGSATVRRFDALTQTPGLQFGLGNDSLSGPMSVDDIAVMPGSPNSIAVSQQCVGFSPRHQGVAIFDDAVKRPVTTPTHTGPNVIEFSTSSATIYGYNNETTAYGLYKMAVDGSGVSVVSTAQSVITGFDKDVRYDNGLLYTTTGRAVDPETATLVGSFSAASGPVAPDSAAGRVYYVTGSTLRVYDTSTFLLKGTLTIPNLTGTPGSLIRWGADGLAFRTDTKVYFISISAIVPTPVTPVPAPVQVAPNVIRLPLATSDLVYDPNTQRVYASVPGAGGSFGNSIVPINPLNGTAGTPVFVGSEPSKLALSSNNQILYLGLDGSGRVRAFDLASQTPGLQFPLGRSPNTGTYFVDDITTMPGNQNVIAVSRRNIGITPRHEGVAIYDNGVMRPVVTSFTQLNEAIEFSDVPTRIYGYDNESSGARFQKLTVDANGVTILSSTPNIIGGKVDIKFDNGRVYSSGTGVANAEAATLAGMFSPPPNASDLSAFVPASSINRIFFVTDAGAATALKAYDTNTFAPVGTYSIPGVTGTAASLVRFGTNGFAFRTSDNQVFFVRTPLAPSTLNLVVNSFGDNADNNLGNSACDTDVAPGDQCTLRAAIQEINADGATQSSIQFDPILNGGAISLSSALPDINATVDIVGPGANLLTVQRSALVGTPSFRVFTIGSGATATISGLTISNGAAVGGSAPANAGGGILTLGTLTLNNSIVSGNTAAAGGGGGVQNFYVLTVNNTIVSGNSGGGISNGTFAVSPIATINNSLISGNTGNSGITNNATFSADAFLFINNTTISNNTTPSTAGGGGIFNASSSFTSKATLTINNSTISGNSASSGGGGGIYNAAVFGNALTTLTVTNSTISGNSCNGDGGGVLHFSNGSGSTATATLTNTTISGNSAGSSGNGGGLFTSTLSSVTNTTLRNAIVAGNFRNAGAIASDVNGAVGAASSFDLIGNGTGMTGISNGANGNQVGTAATPIDPQLGPLANNSGPTQTRALLPGSPALDAGTDVALTTFNGAIDNVQTTVNVADAISIPPGVGFAILANSEHMIVLSRSFNTLTVTRGANGTTAAAHVNGENVFPAFDQRGTNFIRKRDSADVDTVAVVDVGAFEAQASIENISDKLTTEDTPISFSFNVGDAAVITSVTASSGNPTLVPNNPANINVTGSGSTRTLNIIPVANKFGASTITVTVNTASESSSDTFVLTVTAVADTPSVTNSTTNEDTLSLSGLVISRNAADGAEVTHFKITGITNGTLFKNDGVTQINNGDFILAADGGAGLKFRPSPDSFATGSFNVQASVGNTDAGLGGGIVTATITVTPVADTPGVTNATTIINTQSSSGLVITRNPVDGNEVTHFRIEGILNGTLFKNDGVTQLPTNTFITVAEGNAGLKFTPATNLISPASTFRFSVRGATSATGNGLSASATATITVSCNATGIVTNTNDSGAGSLRAALLQTCSGSTVTFNIPTSDPGFSNGVYTITLTTAELSISRSLTVTGPGAQLLIIRRSDAAPNFRIFNISQDITVKLSGLTISNGLTVSADSGGGIFNRSTLTLVDVAVTGNRTSDGAPNRSGGYGGGIYSTGGALKLTNSTVSNNRTGNGGANDRGGFGGGIYANFGSPLTLTNSTVCGNQTGGGTEAGGGAGLLISEAATITNSTICNNQTANAAFGYGGGIYCNGANVTVHDSTIVGNASNGGNGGGIYGGTLLRNTIVANNTIGPGGTGPDINGLTNSEDYNLIGNTSGASFTGFTTHNIVNQNPNLGPLTNNGGPTQTMLPLIGSPAINAGDPTNLPADIFDLDGDLNTTEPLPVDQRGFTRVVNTNFDIGAAETNYSIAATAGTPQSAVINSAFATQFQATVKESNVVLSGISVTFTAPATGASGTFAGGTTMATVTTNASGLATAPVFTANGIAGGPYDVVASLGTSLPTAAFSLTNSQAGTATAVTSSVNPSDLGQNVTFTATVTSSSSTPTGTVQFRDGPNLLGAPVTCVAGVGNSCTAQLSTSTLASGTHTISATYSGDANFLGSVGMLSSDQVVKSPPSISINDISISEGDSGTVNANFTVTISAPSSLTVRVNFATADGSATTANDYQTNGGTVTFLPLETTKPIAVTVNGDVNFESNETFFVNLSNAANATFADNQGLGTILNDDAQGGFISFSQPGYMVGESGGFTTITVNRTNDLSGPATVQYATSDDSGSATVVPCSTVNHIASSRCDFTTAHGTLRFGPGENSKTLVVLISQDNYVEGSEDFTLTLSNPTGGALFVTPSTATITILDDATEPATNPIDSADAFVRQHYHDFLNREPDPDGLAFWSNQITECQQPGATCSAEVRRINVSAAFFLSIEFQETGYLVERLYKVAYGSANGTSNFGGAHSLAVPFVRFQEFLTDTQSIGQGVVVGQPGWEQALENNKVAFTTEFVQRGQFVTSMSPPAFVDRLFLNAGVTPTTAERNAAINEFGSASDVTDVAARARAVRRVAENPTLAQQEKNSAFVLMQYLGYLRRNPNDAPDSDYTGYDFWLNKLNEFNGNFVNAEMVKAFIISGEYRQRFGP